MRIHIIQHEFFEAPGAYLQWAKERHHSISYSKVYLDEQMPISVENFDMLLVMGGPQSLHTNKEECPYFDFEEEVKLIQLCIKKSKYVIGVCLGAQLIGKAYGYDAERSPEKEIGNFPIYLNQDGMNDRNLAHFGKRLIVGHWHNDMPGLSEECRILATSEGCPRQIISYDPKVYGFQCHMEFTKESIQLLIDSEEDLQKKHTSNRFVQNSVELFSYDYSEMNKQLFQFLDNLVMNEKSL